MHDQENSTRDLYNRTASRWIREEPLSLSDFTARPSVFALCEPVVGLIVLDLGCGEGYCSRELHRRGAKEVLDYPPITGKMPVSFLKRLADEIEEVCAVKLEEQPTSLKIAQLRAAVGPGLRIFGGLGGVWCLQELERGSDGLMTGYAYPRAPAWDT